MMDAGAEKEKWRSRSSEGEEICELEEKEWREMKENVDDRTAFLFF